MGSGVVGVGVLRGLGLERSGKRVEVRAEKRDVVHAEASRDDRFIVTKRAISQTEAGHETKVRIVLETRGITGLAVRQHGHARSAVYRCAPRRGAIGRAGVGAGKKGRGEEVGVTVGVDDGAGFGHRRIEVSDITMDVVVARLELVPKTVVESEIRRYLPLVLAVESVVG